VDIPLLKNFASLLSGEDVTKDKNLPHFVPEYSVLNLFPALPCRFPFHDKNINISICGTIVSSAIRPFFFVLIFAHDTSKRKLFLCILANEWFLFFSKISIVGILLLKNFASLSSGEDATKDKDLPDFLS
jgi:hypothetical protein